MTHAKNFSISKIVNSQNIIALCVFGVFLAILSSPFLNYIHFLVIPILFSYFFFFEEPRVILIFIIAAFLVLSRELGDTLRLFVQLANFLLLILLFIYHNRSNIFNLKKFPREIIILMSLFFVAMFSATFVNGSFGRSLPMIILQILFIAMIYVFYSLIDSNRIIKIIIFAIIFSASFHVFATIFAVYKSGFSIFFLENEYFSTLSNSLLTHKNSVAILIFYSLLFLFSLYNIQDNKVRKYFFYLVFIILLVGAILINSRGMFISLIIAILYLTYQLKRKAFVTIIISIIALIIIAFIPPFDEYTQFLLRLESLSSNRDIITTSALRVIENNFWFGTGVAGTKGELYKNLPFILGTPEELWIRKHYYQIEFGHAHNFYLFLLSDLGVLGFIVSILIVYYYVKIGNRVKKRCEQYSKFHLKLTHVLMSLGLGMFVRGILEWGGILSYGTISLDLPFWLGFAILIYLDQKYSDIIQNSNISKI